jgi:hypothetical protein
MIPVGDNDILGRSGLLVHSYGVWRLERMCIDQELRPISRCVQERFDQATHRGA